MAKQLKECVEEYITTTPQHLNVQSNVKVGKESQVLCFYFKEIQSSERRHSINYQPLKTLVEAYERAHQEKNKNTYPSC